VEEVPQRVARPGRLDRAVQRREDVLAVVGRAGGRLGERVVGRKRQEKRQLGQALDAALPRVLGAGAEVGAHEEAHPGQRHRGRRGRPSQQGAGRGAGRDEVAAQQEHAEQAGEQAVEPVEGGRQREEEARERPRDGAGRAPGPGEEDRVQQQPPQQDLPQAGLVDVLDDQRVEDGDEARGEGHAAGTGEATGERVSAQPVAEQDQQHLQVQAGREADRPFEPVAEQQDVEDVAGLGVAAERHQLEQGVEGGQLGGRHGVD
ncbi:MAG: hypothetical protein ACK559_04290, partial [bacterium]